MGSHRKTFLLYVLVRIIWGIGDGSSWNVVDTLSLQLAEKHNGNYNSIFMTVMIPGTIASFLGGYLVIDDPDHPGSCVEGPFKNRVRKYFSNSLFSASSALKTG